MSRLLLVALAVAALAAGEPAPGPAAPAAPALTTPAGEPTPAPSRLWIPAIGVDSPLVRLGVDGAGVLVPPASTDVAGWFAAGPAPGADGPALLAGHLDSRTGPGVFARLVDLRPGARIEVERADGSAVAFVVTRQLRTAKAAFPTELVYAPTPGPELRLVTCGGRFDRATGHYRDNVVVEAVAERRPWTITGSVGEDAPQR